jgi:hypothetical protein
MTPTYRAYLPNPASGKVVLIQDVIRTGRYASLLRPDGTLYEHLNGRFWVTDPRAGRPESTEVVDLDEVPLSTWYHLPACDCGSCGPAG